MKSTSNCLFLSAAVLALAACSSTGGGAPVNPVPLGGAGTPAPSKNLIMTDVSYLHPSSGDGVSETFDLGVSTLTVDVQTVNPGTGQTALVFNESVRGFFDDGNTMFYDATADTFTFNITSGTSTMSETFQNVMLTDPVDLGFRFNNESVVISSNPYIFGFASALADTFLSDPNAVNSYLAGLADSTDPNDQDLLSAIQSVVTDLISNSDFYFYSSNGVNYFHLNLTNNAGTTNYVTLGIWEDATIAGQETYGAAVFGERTPLNEIPTSGTASYTAIVEGFILLNNNIQDLVGSIAFNFNFTTDILDFIYDADIREIGIDGSADFFDYDVFDGTGNINGDTFTGTFVSQTDPSIVGELEGAFFGADADEIGGTLIFGNSSVQGIGGFIGANPEAASQQN